MKESAGILMYRKRGFELEVILVHPSGNYNARAPWGIPKGQPEPGEDLESTARREVWEETGILVAGALSPLGSIQYLKSKKRVHAWAFEIPGGYEPTCASWEIDGAEFFTIKVARRVIHPEQEPFLDRLVSLVG